MPLVDTLGRPLGSLRISVTDRCNLRCLYCMPEESYAWLPREDILTFEETTLLADLFAAEGATRVRLTGGEPLLRRDVETLVAALAAKQFVGGRRLALRHRRQRRRGHVGLEGRGCVEVSRHRGSESARLGRSV